MAVASAFSCFFLFPAIRPGGTMRLRTSPNRTVAVPAAKPRNPVVLAVVQRLGTLSGHRHEDKKSRERLDRLDLDQRVREIGEW
jgi:hypothetical protein